MFSIQATKYWWILENGDAVYDQCLHGHVVVRIGMETLEDDCTVSSTGLLLLRTLTEDHIELGIMGNQMLPNHGFNVYTTNDPNRVILDGDPYGTDWAVRHDGNMIELETMSGTVDRVPLADYRREVFRFCDAVEAYYRASPPRRFYEDDRYETDVHRPGWTAFWNEWRSRRNAQ